MGVVFLSLPYFGVNSTDCSGEFPVIFEHFQNLEDLLNILKELSCGLFFLKKTWSIQNSTKQTAMIKFDISFIFKSTGRTLVPVKELSKATFCHQKNPKKAEQTSFAWKFFQPPIQVCRGAYISCFKITALFSAALIFQRMHQPSGWSRSTK